MRIGSFSLVKAFDLSFNSKSCRDRRIEIKSTAIYKKIPSDSSEFSDPKVFVAQCNFGVIFIKVGSY